MTITPKGFVCVQGVEKMYRFDIPDHPEIECIERTGYPSWMQEDDDDGFDLGHYLDRLYEEERDRGLFGEDYSLGVRL